MSVPFFRPQISEVEIAEVADSLRSGWLTTGPKVRRFEEEFAAAVGGRFAVAVNSATAALHLAVEALGLKPGQGVLVPTHTFAATAEVVRYLGAIPILVDAEPATLNMDLADAEAKLAALREGRLPAAIPPGIDVVGLIPVHVGGLMMDIAALRSFATRHGLWMVEDAAHAFPSSWRADAEAPWVRCGEGTSAVACFSFYANKTITTGEGGMAVTDDPALAERMRLMSLHGLSKDAWGRYAGGPWDYRIVAPGFKYNLTDVAAAIGIHQLARAEAMRLEREAIAAAYREALSTVTEVDLPASLADRVHSWHLFPIRLRLERLTIERDGFVSRLRERGIGFSVHWRPLHLHPYYQETFGWRTEDLPVSSREWQRLVSLPIFPGMTAGEVEQVVTAIRDLVAASCR